MISQGLADRLSEYYIGKLCTIMTGPMSLSLDANTHPQWFTIVIEDIDTECVIGIELSRKTKHLFFFPIMGIVEEQYILPDHPEYDQIKEKMESVIKKEQEAVRNQSMSTNPPPMHTLQPQPMTPQNQVSIESIQQQAAELKQKWSTSSIAGVENDNNNNKQETEGSGNEVEGTAGNGAIANPISQ